MRKKTNKLCTLFLATLMLVAVFAGCSGSTNQPQSASASTSSAASVAQQENTDNRAPAENVSMRAMWWGSQVRHDATIAAIEMYMQQNPNVSIQYEFMGFGDYWQKLNTLIAANDAPDIIQMGNNFLTYKAQIEPLDSYVESGIIDTANIADNFLLPTRINGELVGISLGTNSNVMVYDPAAFEKAGVAEPTTSWTWDDFQQACFSINEKLGIYGISASSDPDFWSAAIYVMQTGGNIFNADGTALGYDDENLMSGYFQIKRNLQERNGVYPTPDVMASVKDIQGDLIVTGKAAIAWANSNQLIAMTEAAGRELKVAPYPKITADGPSGMSVRSSSAFCVSAGSPHKEEAAKFISYFVNDIEANSILNGERGVPISSVIRDSLYANASDENKAIFAYIDLIGQIASHPQAVEPSGQIELQDVYKRVNEELAFGQITPEEASAKFYKEASEVLERTRA